MSTTYRPALAPTRRKSTSKPSRSSSTRPRSGQEPRLRPAGQKFVLIGLVLVAFYSVAPVWWLIVSSTKNRRDLYNSNGLWFAHMNLGENLHQLLTYNGGIFLRWTVNSIMYAGVGALVCTLISLAAGYSLSRFEYRGRGLGLAIVIGSFLIPSALLTLPMYLLFSNVGLVNTPWALLIPSFISPFAVYLSKVYVDGSVPAELLEAARMDGAGEVRIFFQIVVRIMTTGAATVFLLTFVQNWNSFFLPLTMLRGSDKWTLSLGLYNLIQKKQDAIADPTTLVITGALLSTIPLAILMIAMQRYWRTGVTLGALK